ncbi:MAG TPA: response regulator transcription factor [Desulfuromonadales bacterium]|nr:response regulator transcription factor [Desulfuromonadales bacterium]
MSGIRVLIADDHPIVRKGLRQLLEAEADMEVVEEAGDGMEALEKARVHHPDVLLLDIAMPRLTGLETAQMVKDTSPETKVVILSMYEKEAYARQALDAGALGYILKGGPSEEILGAIRAVAKGRYFLSSSITSSVVDVYLKGRSTATPDEGYQSLSERERQVFMLLVEGLSTIQIADTLCISPKTVEKHRLNIATKLGMDSPVEMVKYAIRIGLVDPDIWKS